MPLEQLRPLGFGEILDAAFTLYRRHFRVFALTSLLAFAPGIVMWACFVALGGKDPNAWQIVVVGMTLTFFSAAIATGALVQQASSAYLAQAASVKAGFRAAARCFGTLALVLLLKWTAALVGLFLLVVPALFVVASLFALAPAVVLERAGAAVALWRTRDLSRQALLRVLALMLTAYLIAWLVLYGVSYSVGLAGAMGLAVAPGTVSLVTSVARALVYPLQVITTVVLYFDRRVRTEALDLATYAPPPAALATA
jgi:hypothetical protein